jgi:hypothetical protein
MMRNVVLRLDKFEHEKIVPRRKRNRSKKVKIFHRLKGTDFHAFFKHLRTCIFILFACISFYAVESLVLHYILFVFFISFVCFFFFFFFFCKRKLVKTMMNLLFI